MVPVKIECACGQHYAFDAEPVNGQLASSVACPACGADGTGAANEIIARSLPQPGAPAPPASSSGNRIHVSLSAADHQARLTHTGVRVSSAVLGLVDRSTAEIEARAKISWGDSLDEVIRYLMLQGFTATEAKETVDVLFKERLAELRVKGIRKIFTGIGLMFVPVIEGLIFVMVHLIFLKLMAIGVMVGLWGVWQLLNGIVMLAAPKMESGDVAA